MSKEVREATNRAFRLLPNNTLRGNTWDANHMDRFLKSQWADRQTLDQTATHVEGVQERRGKQTVASTNIRPSACFISIPKGHDSSQFRDDNDLGNVFTEWNDSRDKAAQRVKGQVAVDPAKLSNTSNPNINPNSGLAVPSERRQEIREVQDERKRHTMAKEELSLYKKRERIIKNGYRNGVLGLDSPDKPDSVYFRDLQQARREEAERKAVILQRRQEDLNKYRSASSDIPFSNPGYESPIKKPANARQVSPDWKSKRVSGQRFLDSHQRLFIEDKPKQMGQERMKNMLKNETKGRKFDIISNARKYENQD